MMVLCYKFTFRMVWSQVLAYMVGENLAPQRWRMRDWIADGTDPPDYLTGVQLIQVVVDYLHMPI